MKKQSSNRFLTRFVLYALIVLLLQGCAKSSLLSSWSNPAYHGPVTGPILVVGVFRNPTAHAIYENSFVDNIEKTGIRALPSSRFTQQTTTLSKQQLQEIIHRSGAKEILITSLLGERVKQEELPPIYDDVVVFSYWDEVVGATYVAGDELVEGQDVSQHYDTMEAVLFDADTGKRLWAARSQSINLDDYLRKDDNQLEELFIDDLKKHKLL